VGLAVLAGACVSLTSSIVSPAEFLSLRMRPLTRRRLWGSGKWARCWTRECRRWAVPALQTCLRLSLTSVSVWIERSVRVRYALENSFFRCREVGWWWCRRGISDRAGRITEQKAKSNSSSSRRSRTNNAVPNGGGPRILSTLVSSASPGDCGSMGVGVFGSGFAAALFGAGTLQGFED
jgi:hypothetical protein